MENYKDMKKGGLVMRICKKCNGCGSVEKKERKEHKEYNRVKVRKRDDENNMNCARCHGFYNKELFVKKDNTYYKTCNGCRVRILSKYHLSKKNV